MRLSVISIALCSLFSPNLVHAADEPSAEKLASVFRSLLSPSIPKPLVEQNMNWGHQEMTPNGIKWEKKGILLKPEVKKKLQNDGTWRKIVVTADDPDKTLEVKVKDVKIPETGRMTFGMIVHMPVHLKFEQQLWRSGVRLYSGETRARCKVVLQLQCESTSRLEKSPGSFVPDLVLRLRVVDAKLTYYDFVVEHTVGVGGDFARILGDTVHDVIKGVKPSLERDLLDKANAAIVKAGDTREVRLGLGKLLEKK